MTLANWLELHRQDQTLACEVQKGTLVAGIARCGRCRNCEAAQESISLFARLVSNMNKGKLDVRTWWDRLVPWLQGLGAVALAAALVGLLAYSCVADQKARTAREFDIPHYLCVDYCVKEFFKGARASAIVGAAAALQAGSQADFLKAVEDYCGRKFENRKCCGSRLYAYTCDEESRHD